MKTWIVTDETLFQMEQQTQKYSFKDKLQAAELLGKLGVDRICLPQLHMTEEGVCREDAVICKTLAESMANATVAVAADSKETLAAAWECVKETAHPSLRVLLPISTVQMEYQYHKKAEAMKKIIAELCAFAKTLTADVEFVARDATRAEAGFAAECAKVAFENGATAITICDDAGVFLPDEFAALIKEIKALTDGNMKVYIKPSNALGMAYAIAFESFSAGADGIVTVTGSESEDVADTARLAQLCRARGDVLGLSLGIDMANVHKIATRVAFLVAESERQSAGKYESRVAAASAKEEKYLSASATLAEITLAVKDLGYVLSDEDLGRVFEEFSRVVAKKEKLEMRELEAVVASSAMQVPSTYHLESYVVNSGTLLTATANVVLVKDGVKLTGVSAGDGPIDAAFHAIEQIVGHHYELDDFRISAVTKGREAIGSSLIRLRKDGKLYAGNGVSPDIIGACIRAYINALNKIVYESNC